MEPKKETVTLEELTISNMYELEALINVLERKGIIMKEEILREIVDLKKSATKKIN